MKPYFWCFLAAFLVSANLFADEPPPVTSADLVARFVAETDYLRLEGSNEVSSWTAANDSSIQLLARGTNDPENIRFDPSGLDGLGSLVVRDYSGDNRYLRGSLNLDQPLTDATIFWLGKYQPGAEGSLGDGAGQYVYCFGRATQQGAQMDHQIDDGNFELYGGSGTQTGSSIAHLNDVYSVWATEYFSAQPGHVAEANGVDLNIPTDGGYSVPQSEEFQLFGWQNGSGAAGGYNFVGEISEILIYRGHLSAEERTAVEDYLNSKLPGDPPPPPPRKTYTAVISGMNQPQDDFPNVLAPYGNKGLFGYGVFTFDPSDNTMDWEIHLEPSFANRYAVTQAHFYNLSIKPNGDSIFCWGGRWSDHEFLFGEDYSVAADMASILNQPEDWILVLHTEGGHFAVDEQGNLIEYDPLLHEVSETGQAETGARFNNRVPRKLTDLTLREYNPNSGGFGNPDFDAVYPDPNHFDREADKPFPDASGNHWIRWDKKLGRYVPTPHGLAKGLTNADIDTKEYLFYLYDDQGPSWDYGGPEGAASGVFNLKRVDQLPKSDGPIGVR